MSSTTKLNRYKHDGEILIVEVSVKNSRQLFNERDPAPFRERDLDSQFVTYLLSTVEEFPLSKKMKIRILTEDIDDLKADKILIIGEAIGAYFRYESTLLQSKMRKRRRTARYFALIGLITLIVCLSIAQLIDSIKVFPRVTNVVSVSLMIIGWVAMWHPIDSLLYDWWPIQEQRKYFDKIALFKVEIVSISKNYGMLSSVLGANL